MSALVFVASLFSVTGMVRCAYVYLKHKRRKMSMEDLILRLRVEEDHRKGDKVDTMEDLLAEEQMALDGGVSFRFAREGPLVGLLRFARGGPLAGHPMTESVLKAVVEYVILRR
ncbi:hypothetical protein ACOSP7_013167 [Xanthoceras sorbifolium]